MQKGKSSNKSDKIAEAYVRRLISRIIQREPDSHKGDYGTAVIIGGRLGVSGCVALAAKAAFRSGIGKAFCVTEEANFAPVLSYCPEAMCISSSSRGGFDSLRRRLDRISRITTAVIGPGIGIDAMKKRFVVNMVAYLKERKAGLIIDADAIRLLREHTELLKETIITPHPEEFHCIARKGIRFINENRESAAVDFAIDKGCVVLLKGQNTVCADEAKVYVNRTGNPGMATAGAGDVLDGVIAGLIGQGLGRFEAAAAGAYIHGLAGDIAAKEKGIVSMTAADIIECLPKAFLKAV